MKRLILAGTFVLAVAVALPATQFRLTGQAAFESHQANVFAAMAQDQVYPKGGIGWEITFGHIGLSGSAMAFFNEYDTGESILDFDGRVGLTYHLFGERSFFDPFVAAGAGCSGQVDLNGMGGLDVDPYDIERVAIGLYPYLGAGIGLHFHEGFIVSSQWNWKPSMARLPAAPISTPRYGSYELVFAVGVALGR